MGDLGHILQASGVGAEVRIHDLPLAPALRELPLAQRLECLLAGGDDYELLFTAPPEARARVEAASVRSATPVTRVGHITAAPGLRWLDADGRDMPLAARSFDHFA